MKIEIEIGAESEAKDIKAARIERAAKQFEGILLNQLLAPLVERDKSLGQNEEEDGAANQVRQVAVQALSNAISNGGGIGVARMLVRQLQGQR